GKGAVEILDLLDGIANFRSITARFAHRQNDQHCGIPAGSRAVIDLLSSSRLVQFRESIDRFLVRIVRGQGSSRHYLVRWENQRVRGNALEQLRKGTA